MYYRCAGACVVSSRGSHGNGSSTSGARRPSEYDANESEHDGSSNARQSSFGFESWCALCEVMSTNFSLNCLLLNYDCFRHCFELCFFWVWKHDWFWTSILFWTIYFNNYIKMWCLLCLVDLRNKQWFVLTTPTKGSKRRENLMRLTLLWRKSEQNTQLLRIEIDFNVIFNYIVSIINLFSTRDECRVKHQIQLSKKKQKNPVWNLIFLFSKTKSIHFGTRGTRFLLAHNDPTAQTSLVKRISTIQL